MAETGRRLVLFDLDGTLLDVFQYHYDSLDTVMEKIWGTEGVVPDEEGYGMPQGEYMRRLCLSQGVPEAQIAEHLDAAQAALTRAMARALPADLRSRRLPGSFALLRRLQEAGIPLALVTGTLGPTARILVERAELVQFFPVAAYGDEAALRVELIRLALKRAACAYDLSTQSLELITVGDAPYDIEAGREMGARTVAVASGPFTVAELRPYEPDVLLESFDDHKAAFLAILGSAAARVQETVKEQP